MAKLISSVEQLRAEVRRYNRSTQMLRPHASPTAHGMH